MRINTVGELKNILKNINDDFTLTIKIRTKVSDEELENRTWKYPYDFQEAIIEFNDIAYSDKRVAFGIERK